MERPTIIVSVTLERICGTIIMKNRFPLHEILCSVKKELNAVAAIVVVVEPFITVPGFNLKTSTKLYSSLISYVLSMTYY